MKAGARHAGKVVFVTGVARGQGKAHALRFAHEGAFIVGVDLAKPDFGLDYQLSSPDDLDRTRDELAATGAATHIEQCDVRDLDGLERVLQAAVNKWGRLDVVIANAGIGAKSTPTHELSPQLWQDMLDVNLTGVWNTIRSAVPHLIAGGRGGCIILTSSAAGLRAYPGIGHYVAAKHGVVGLMKTLAVELGPHGIRVNSLHPTQVDTPMIMNEGTYRLFVPDHANPGRSEFAAVSQAMHVLPTPWVEADDVANAAVWLCSDDARFITGATLPIDAGVLIK